ncbi:MAG: 4Fe-4S dicluster domain-containing protein [Bacteroidales bacterium]|nr:4Fe-4S dicluster domain-containing protein [Bacteroidales bacterium]
MLKYIRIVLAAVMLTGVTALLLCGGTELGGWLRQWCGWIPKVQLLPAVLAMNTVVVLAVLLVTLLIGRAYCSVVCPMGIFQDIFVWFHRIIFGKKRKYKHTKPSTILRYAILILFILALLVGMNSIATIIAPYSAYARMVTGIHATGIIQWVAIITLVVIGLMSFVWGRLWCNTICPVGSLLGLLSRFSLFRVRIDADKCIGCHACEHRCKAMCIDIDGGKTVDGIRCVDCMDCLAQCPAGAISLAKKSGKSGDSVDSSRRKFIVTGATVGTALAVHAQEQKLDGGLATLMGKEIPERKTPLKPFGSQSLKNFTTHCTSCQLCVSQCPEKVLRPSTKLSSLMQPEMGFSDGYCRMACTRCSEVCPTGAIHPISKEEKTAISIGHAVVLADNCIGCGACARHCPSSAIMMVDGKPAVNESRCLGCGACEYYCPARPVTAIYVEGKETHSEI